MRSQTIAEARRASGYHPSQTNVEYEKPELLRIATIIVYEKHTRIIRSWDPKTRTIIGREVEKIRMDADGRTPHSAVMAFVEVDGKKIPRPQTDIIPITKPIRLKAGSPKALYRTAKNKAKHAC